MVNKMTDFTPLIILPGFGQSKAAVYDENNQFVKQAWPLKADVKALGKRLVKPYLKTVLCRKDRGFTDTAYDLFAEVFEPLSTLPDGQMKYNLKAVSYALPMNECGEKIRNYVYKLVPVKKLAQKIGDENIFFFAYNAFDDPFDLADRLEDFVAYVKEKRQCEKVNLLAFSMGGPVATAYFEKYGERNEIKRTLFLCSALAGSVMQADMLKRNFDKKQGYSLLGFATNDGAVKTFRRVLGLTTWETRYAMLRRSIDAVCDSLMYNSAGMWGLIPPSEYEALAQKFIGDEAHKELKAKTDRFFAVQNRLDVLIRKMQAQGTAFFAVAGYGSRIMELSLSGQYSTDGIVPVFSCAPGTISSDLGKTLDVKNPDPAYLSPDKSLYAGNTLLRDSTWFIKGLKHGGTAHSVTLLNLVTRIFSDDSFAGVNDEKEYSRFMSNLTE